MSNFKYFLKLKDFYKNSQYIIYEDGRSGIAHLRFVTDSDERVCSVWINYPVLLPRKLKI